MMIRATKELLQEYTRVDGRSGVCGGRTHTRAGAAPVWGRFACVVVLTIAATAHPARAAEQRVETSQQPPLADTERTATAKSTGQNSSPERPAPSSQRFPWLLLPVFSASPKLGTAGGALTA